MKACALFLFVFFTVAGYSQNSINNYKYVFVPERFDFAKEDNQYGLNTTTKLLLEQKGFTVIGGNEALPPLVAANKCNALRVELIQRSTFFVTGLTLQLKDCQGNVIFKGKEGKSREKEFPAAYGEALRNAFQSLHELPYKYDSTALIPSQQGGAGAIVSGSGSVTAAAAGSAPVSTGSASAKPAAVDITGVLYAQAIGNGYQLIDTSPKKVLTLRKTSIDDTFIAETGVSGGIVFKKNGDWFFEYYKDEKLISQKLQIKF